MSDYLDNVIQASGGHAAPVENLKEQDIRASLEAAGMLVPEEQDLADALLKIVEKYGKFNDDNSGVWAGYDSAEKNAENAKIGVKCGNCVFYNAPNGCSIIVAQVEEGGLCRFAVLPDGAVNASGGFDAPEETLDEEDLPEGYHRMPDGTVMKDSDHENEAALEKDSDDPCWKGYVQVGMKNKNGKRVPNCVPSAASIDYVVESVSSDFGASRLVSKESAYEVARAAVDKYEYLSDDALYEAVLWEVQSFVEYATTGESGDLEDLAAYTSLLPEGHPATEPSIIASASWVAGAPDFDTSSRDAVVTAFSESEDYVSSMHATTRLRAIISSGNLSSTTLYQLKDLVSRYSKVD